MSEPKKRPEERFSNRAGYYARSRPGYPDGVVKILREECGLAADGFIADVGSGTGLLARLLLAHGFAVHAVEPNEPMRLAAVAELGAMPGFVSIPAKAEATTLPDQSVDLITVAQAIHWFEPEATRREFARILKPEGWLAIVNNQRDSTVPVLGETHAILADYREQRQEGVDHWEWSDELAARYFGPGGWRERTCANQQVLDREGFLGRWLSQSVMPAPGAAGHDEMVARLGKVFEQHQTDGTVTLPYETRVWAGHVR